MRIYVMCLGIRVHLHLHIVRMSIFYDITPIPFIVASSGSLLLRDSAQERGVRRATGLRQNRKMILQFIFTFVDYIILDLPLNTHMIMRRLGITNLGTNVATFLS